MTIDERVDGALAELDHELVTGKTVVSAVARVAAVYGLPSEVVRLRAERQLGPLSPRRRLLILKRRSREDVKEFLSGFEINSDWQSLLNLEWDYEAFLSAKYRKKVSTQRKLLAEDALRKFYQHDVERREADRKARGVRLRRW